MEHSYKKESKEVEKKEKRKRHRNNLMIAGIALKVSELCAGIIIKEKLREDLSKVVHRKQINLTFVQYAEAGRWWHNVKEGQRRNRLW